MDTFSFILTIFLGIYGLFQLYFRIFSVILQDKKAAVCRKELPALSTMGIRAMQAKRTLPAPHKGIRYRPANKNTRNIHIPSIAMQGISRQTGLEHPYLRGYTNKIYHDNFDIWINAPQPPTSIKAAHQNLYNKRIQHTLTSNSSKKEAVQPYIQIKRQNPHRKISRLVES